MALGCHQGNNPYIIGVSQCSHDAWRETMNYEIFLEAALGGDITVEFISANNDSEKQIRDIENFLEKKVDLLIVSPNESRRLTPVISKVYDAGIPVILVDRKTDNEKYSAFVGGNNRQIGEMVAGYISGRTSSREDVNVFLVRGLWGSSADRERYEGFVSSLPDNVHIAGETYANFVYEFSYSNILNLLANGTMPEDVDVVYAFNDMMAIGVHDAYEEYDPELEKPFIVGVDALPTAMQTISDGIIDASFTYPTGGSKIVDIARRILNGEQIEKETLLSSVAVDSNNVRIMQMQLRQMLEQQEKLDNLNTVLQQSTDKYRQQQKITYLLAFMVLIAIVLIVFLYLFNSQKKNLNSKLVEQNNLVKQHMEDLANQKNQLVEMSHRLEETTQAKLVFFTNISHEFKTPLSLISGPVNDILSTADLDKETKTMLEIVHRNTSKLERLIVELLDFRSYENGKMVMNPQMGDMNAFLKNIVSIFDDAIKRRGITFSYTQDGSDFNVPFDPKKTEKVFTNLMSNAFNHVNKRGIIKVSIRTVGNDVEISVFNSGSYVPVGEREKIFQRFYSLDTEQKGTGIGLALVMAIMDACGGSISVESEEGVGTTFIARFPRSAEYNTEYVVDPDYVPEFARQKYFTMVEEDDDDIIVSNADVNKPVVLVIEDNIDMRSYLKSILQTDYCVILAPDGEEGIAKAAKYNPALVISDIMMPKKDGFEVCRELRSSKQTENTPVILLTACAFEDQQACGYESGADAYIQKPFSVKTLKVRIAKLLEKSRQVKAAISGEWLIGFTPDSSNNKAMELIAKIRSYVEENIDEEISVDALSLYLGMSKSKLYRELKGITEYSPIDLANMIKLKKAIDLVIYQQYSISQAAFNSGFTSPSYFSRTFQKYYHEKPSEYIKRKMRQ